MHNAYRRSTLESKQHPVDLIVLVKCLFVKPPKLITLQIKNANI